MGKSLVLAEKPSVGREIARVLGCHQKNKGYIEGNNYIVTWALGHLVTLADPEKYDEKYRTWNLADLPMLPDRMELVVIKQSSKQYSAVKNLLKRNDVSDLVIATDSGREGELVARWIIQKARFKKPLKRLWISSQTDKAIKEGFSNLKPSKDYDNLYMSAQCRAEADWLVGLNATRALTCRYNAQLSAGRVQTPTLAIIVEREEEIRKFVPQDYWNINAQFNGINVIWQDKKTGQTRIFEKEKADTIVSKVKDKTGKVSDVRKESKKEMPPLAYDLTELQRDANKKYGYSAKQTSGIMQRLYEIHKLTTYPRTDSRYITDDIVPTLKERLKSIAKGPYTAFVRNILKDGIRVTKRFADNSKVTDHHAIIPTEQEADLTALDKEELNIYDLIVKRFLAVLYPPFIYEETTIIIESEGEKFTAKGRFVKDPGWRAVYAGMKMDEEDDEDRQSIPDIKPGQISEMRAVKATGKKTKPPSRYTEATLLTAMENPSRFIEDKELKQAIESTSGLGTPATRADIIEKLFNTFYIEKKGKEIFPTSKGKQIVEIVPEDLKSPVLTAKWEQQLSAISRGKASPEAFISKMRSYASGLVGKIAKSTSKFKHDNVTQEKCRCGKFLLEVTGKKGKMRLCPDRECGYRRTISQISNARCPECHKMLEMKGEGDNKTFACSCGYRESLSDFKRRRGDKADKREVSRYLNQQKKSEPSYTPFADAFKKKDQ